jgi:hypothetical protein
MGLVGCTGVERARGSYIWLHCKVNRLQAAAVAAAAAGFNGTQHYISWRGREAAVRWGDSHMLPGRGVRVWVVYLTPKIERVVSLLHAFPIGEAGVVPMP